MTIHGIILAAGRGSRLGELTANKPKPLTVLGGKPLIEWQLSALEEAGVVNTYLVTGYQQESLLGYGAGHYHNPKWHSSNMVRSLMSADEVLSSSVCIVSYGDITYPAAHVQALISSSSDIAITSDINWLALWSERFEDPFADAETFRHNGEYLIEIGKRSEVLSDFQGQFMGLIRFSPQGWQKVKQWLGTLPDEQVDRLDMTAMLAKVVGEGLPVQVVPANGRWVEVDNPSDITLYENATAQSGWHHDWR